LIVDPIKKNHFFQEVKKNCFPKMALQTSQSGDGYSHILLPDTKVSDLVTLTGLVDPTNRVDYKDDQGEEVTPLPLFIPEKAAPTLALSSSRPDTGHGGIRSSDSKVPTVVK
jgi:hypothetical protein